jgi:DNA-binding GntR family transcriptional regulator
MLKADAVYEIVLDQIVNTKLSPGEHFTEKQIVKSSGYGAMPVREAMDRLRRDGLIHTQPRQGNLVAPITLESSEDFFEVWNHVIPLLYQLAAKRISDPLFAALQKNFTSSKKALGVKGTNARTLVGIATARLSILIDAADNHHLRMTTERLLNESNRIVSFICRDPKNRGDVRKLFELYEGKEVMAFKTHNGVRAARIAGERAKKLRSLVIAALLANSEEK